MANQQEQSQVQRGWEKLAHHPFHLTDVVLARRDSPPPLSLSLALCAILLRSRRFEVCSLLIWQRLGTLIPILKKLARSCLFLRALKGHLWTKYQAGCGFPGWERSASPGPSESLQILSTS